MEERWILKKYYKHINKTRRYKQFDLQTARFRLQCIKFLFIYKSMECVLGVYHVSGKFNFFFSPKVKKTYNHNY